MVLLMMMLPAASRNRLALALAVVGEMAEVTVMLPLWAPTLQPPVGQVVHTSTFAPPVRAPFRVAALRVAEAPVAVNGLAPLMLLLAPVMLMFSGSRNQVPPAPAGAITDTLPATCRLPWLEVSTKLPLPPWETPVALMLP